MSGEVDRIGGDSRALGQHRPQRWAGTLALLGALLGGLVGWRAQDPVYRSEGTLRFEWKQPDAEMW